LGASPDVTMKRVCFLFMALLVTLGCSRSGVIERRIGERVDGCDPAAPCIIRVKDVTDFPWEKMYAFDYGVSHDQIEKALGVPYPNYIEFQRRLVFLNDGKIVHREDEPTDIERPVTGEVIFAETDGVNQWSYTPDTAVFSGKKVGPESESYYVLSQLK
jgi:hypothetical protein